MKARIRKKNKDGVVRMETSGRVKEIVINEDILHPDKETVSVCFRGNNSSGIIDFTPREIEHIMKSVQGRMNLIKGFKRLGPEDSL